MATSSSPPRRAFLATAATIGIFSLLVGQVQFAGYDSSLLIDAGWRIAQGQHPYTDFISTLPPSFALLAGAAFRVFGLHWMALNAAATLIYWLLFALGLSLAPRREDSRLGTPLLALYLAALSLPLLVTSHLWHSTLAAQLDTALLFTLLQLYRQLERDGTVARRAMAGASLLAGAVLLSKPNTAAVCLLASAIFPLLSRRPRQAFTAWLTILLTGSLLATALLALSGQSPLTVLASYRGISGRPEPLVMLLGGPPTAGTPRDWSLVSTFSTEAILLMLAGAALLRLNKRTYLLRSPAFAAALAGSAVTLCGLVTNWDLKFNDLAPGFFGLGALLLACEDEAIQGKKRNWFLPVVAALTLAIALALSLGRVRMQMEGPWASPPSQAPSSSAATHSSARSSAAPSFGRRSIRPTASAPKPHQAAAPSSAPGSSSSTRAAACPRRAVCRSGCTPAAPTPSRASRRSSPSGMPSASTRSSSRTRPASRTTSASPRASSLSSAPATCSSPNRPIRWTSIG